MQKEKWKTANLQIQEMSESEIPITLGKRPKAKNPFWVFLQEGFCPPKTDSEDDNDDILSPVTPRNGTPEKSSNIRKKRSPKKKNQSQSGTYVKSNLEFGVGRITMCRITN